MERKLFREKSIDRISSPEELNDYVRVSNPGIWISLAAIIVLLIGVCVWGFFGRMDTAITISVVVKDGNAVCYVRDSDITDVKIGQTVRTDNGEYVITSISDAPVAVSDNIDAYARHIGSLTEGEWVYKAEFTSRELKDGIYLGKIVTESVRPISFIIN